NGDVTLTLYDIPADFTGTIVADGLSPVIVSITTPGQNGALTFAGTAGQRMSLRGSNGSIAGQIWLACDVNVSIVRASDNLTVAAPACMEGDGFIDPVPLPTTDTYKIFIDPYSLAKGDLTLTLYTVTDYSGS